MKHRLQHRIATGAMCALAILSTGCASGNGLSGLRMVQAGPDVVAVLACPAVACGVDTYCATGYEFEDVKTSFREHVDIMKPIVIQASGPLGDKLVAGGSLGRLVSANGRFSGDVFAARELTLKKDDLPTDTAGAVIKAVTEGLCDPPAANKTGTVALTSPAASASPALLRTTTCPEPVECRAVLRRAQRALGSVLDTDVCRNNYTISAESESFSFLNGGDNRP